MALKVAIADASELFRSLLKRWIASESSLKFVGETSTGGNLLQMAGGKKPDILLMDPILPDTCGFETAKTLREKMPQLIIIALYHCSRPYLIDQMHKTGFNGCICKRTNAIDVLKNAIESTINGNAFFCPETCRAQNQLYNDKNSFSRILSAREQEVLSLIGAGMDNEEIGKRLELSAATVQTHRRNLFRKLGIHDTPALMRYAMQQGFWQECAELKDMPI